MESRPSRTAYSPIRSFRRSQSRQVEAIGGENGGDELEDRQRDAPGVDPLEDLADGLSGSVPQQLDRGDAMEPNQDLGFKGVELVELGLLVAIMVLESSPPLDCSVPGPGAIQREQ